MNDVDAILAVTEEDAAAYRRLGATVPLHVAPVGMEPDDWPDLSGRGEPATLVFLGSLDWRPNLEAVRWFVGEIWPLVRAEVPGARFLLAGSNPPARLAAAGRREGIEFLGRVADVRRFLASGTAVVVPVLSGGGVRVKILEAMALGVPVVSTRLGATGIAARESLDLLLADGAAEFAAACVGLLRDPDRAAALGKAGRQRILEGYDALRIARELLGFLDGLPRRRSAR
jgi:glycosyltransferase involved in cell wall biosynthesis